MTTASPEEMAACLEAIEAYAREHDTPIACDTLHTAAAILRSQAAELAKCGEGILTLLVERDAALREFEELKNLARLLLDAIDERAQFSPLQAYSPEAHAWRAKYDAAEDALRAELSVKEATA